MSPLRLFFTGFAALAAVFLSGAARADQSAWHVLDRQELARARQVSPRAGELFDTAESKLRAGDLVAAEKALAEARTLASDNYLLARRHCEVLTELHRPTEAIAACKQSWIGSNAMEQRAYVGALMSKEGVLSPAVVMDAIRAALAAQRLHNQPFFDAAMCDIAHRLGDEAMLNIHVENLQRMAPNHFETRRWQSVQKREHAWALWLGWLALAAAVAGTALHALWRWLRKPAKGASRAAVIAVGVLLVAGVSKPAAAQEAAAKDHWQLSRFAINHDNPEANIPSIEERNKDPLEFGYFLQDLNTEALKAERLGDYRKALKYWRATIKAVPDAAVGYSKACKAHQVLGEREQALEYCSKALNIEGTTQEDYLRFGELMNQKPTPLDPQEIQDLDAVVEHLRQEHQDGAAAVVECRTGVKLEDQVRLKRCTDVLAKLSPEDARSMTFMWSYALLRKDYGAANKLVAAMEKAGMPAPALASVKAATAKASAWWRRPLTDWRYAVASLLGLVLFVGIVVLMKRRAGQADQTSGGGGANAGAAPAA